MIDVVCCVCGKTFPRKPYLAKRPHQRGHFCNFACYSKWQSENLRGKNNPFWSHVILECENCGRTFELQKSVARGRRFCNRQCFLDFVRVDYPSPDALYNTLWDKNRQLALKRDGFACVDCGSQHRILVHHKKAVRNIIADALLYAHALDNLSTVCEGCHAHRHNRRSRSRKSRH